MSLPGVQDLRPRVGDLRQVASVRRIVLDDGPEQGVRVIAFSTGGGLDFWVTADRSLDIGTLSWRGRQVGWQSPAGLRSPMLSDAESDGGAGFGRGFGGFLVTCGFDHIRQPAGDRPLHGHLPFTSARLIAHGVDWEAAEPVLYCEGEVTQWRHRGEGFVLRRRIEAPVGGSSLRLIDTIENIGPEAAGPLVLYHFNLGYPVLADGTQVALNGARVAGPFVVPRAGETDPSTLHQVGDGDWAECVVSGAGDAPTIRWRWRTATLPFLQLWQDLRPRLGVLSVEPCNAGRLADGGNAPPPMLSPGARVRYEMTVEAGDPVR